LWIGSIVVAALAVAGCSSSDPTIITGPQAPRLRAVHAVPDGTGLDLYVDDRRVLTNGQYTQVSNYQGFGVGAHLVEVSPFGSRTPLVELTPALAADAFYTLLILNRLASIETVLLTDNNTAPASGQIKLRVVHAAPSAGPADIYATAPGADLSAATPVLTNVGFKAASAYISVPAGDVQIRATDTGTKTVTMDTGTLTVAAGAIRTVLVMEKAGGGAPYRLQVAVDN
jgi:hypothetical protein